MNSKLIGKRLNHVYEDRIRLNQSIKFTVQIIHIYTHYIRTKTFIQLQYKNTLGQW